MNKLVLSLIVCFLCLHVYSQEAIENNPCLNMTLGYGNKHFVIGIDNPIDIVDNYNQAIAKEDVSAIFEHYESRNKRDLEILGCLLYTSPSPRDRTRSRMPSSA